MRNITWYCQSNYSWLYQEVGKVKKKTEKVKKKYNPIQIKAKWVFYVYNVVSRGQFLVWAKKFAFISWAGLLLPSKLFINNLSKLMSSRDSDLKFELKNRLNVGNKLLNSTCTIYSYLKNFFRKCFHFTSPPCQLRLLITIAIFSRRPPPTFNTSCHCIWRELCEIIQNSFIWLTISIQHKDKLFSFFYLDKHIR